MTPARQTPVLSRHLQNDNVGTLFVQKVHDHRLQ
jgi:hypothetical protein